MGSLYVYTSSVITPLPLDLAPRRLLVLLPNKVHFGETNLVWDTEDREVGLVL